MKGFGVPPRGATTDGQRPSCRPSTPGVTIGTSKRDGLRIGHSSPRPRATWRRRPPAQTCLCGVPLRAGAFFKRSNGFGERDLYHCIGRQLTDRLYGYGWSTHARDPARRGQRRADECLRGAAGLEPTFLGNVPIAAPAVARIGRGRITPRALESAHARVHCPDAIDCWNAVVQSSGSTATNISEGTTGLRRPIRNYLLEGSDEAGRSGRFRCANEGCFGNADGS